MTTAHPILAIASESGLTGDLRILYCEFMADRFPHEHRNPNGYAREWANRFASGDAWTYSDSITRRTLVRLISELEVEIDPHTL